MYVTAESTASAQDILNVIENIERGITLYLKTANVYWHTDVQKKSNAGAESTTKDTH